VRRWVWIVASGAGLVWMGARAAGAFRAEVAGDSMLPSLRPGDWLVATRQGRLLQGRVVVVAHPKRSVALIKRLAGTPGDVVEGIRLGADQFLVVGDNEARSIDGRTFGPVQRTAIEGVVRLRYWPHPRLVR
jgi:nickel-type superoxide dismutase maturation protease